MTSPPSPPPATRAAIGPIAVLVAMCVLPELLFQLAEAGLAGPAGLRGAAYAFGAFQSDLVSGDRTLFSGQSFTMFLTYMFLHTGPTHLAVNMMGLVWLWWLVRGARPAGDAALFFVMAGIGAGIVFDLLGGPHTTMVGASGALFGLLGVYGVDSRLFWSDARHTRLVQRMARLVLIAGALILSDLLGGVATGAGVAWQAHAGGFLTGAVVAMIWPYR